MTGRSDPTQFDKNDPPGLEPESASGTDPELMETEHSPQLDHAKTIAKVLNGISIAAMVWGLFFPRPNEVMIALLAGLPLVAIAMLAPSKGLYHMGGLRSDRRPSLGPAFLGCGLVLSLRALQEINLHPLYWVTAITSAILVGGILTLIVVRADARSREGTWALILVVASVYSYGAIAEADTLLDWSTPTINEVLVLRKHYSSGRRGTPSWYLRVERSVSFPEPHDVPVSGTLYQSVSPGQTVCIKLYSGALNIPWYFVSACR
jgi:hypothetical protein